MENMLTVFTVGSKHDDVKYDTGIHVEDDRRCNFVLQEERD